MFHRVKSEEEKTQTVSAEKELDNSAETKTEGSASVENSNVSDQASDKATETKTEEPSATKTSPETPQKKDEKTMSEQDHANTAEAAPTTQQYQPTRTVGGYPGAYPGTKSSSETDNASASDRRLTIGSGITMSGEIEACDYLLVEGTVEAALKGANILEIAESGVFYGTVEINEANISGRFEGDITVNGRLSISSTGTVTGSISYKEIEIEAGAVLDGKLTPLSQAPAAAKKPPVAKPAPKAAKPAPAAPKAEKQQQPEPANNDGGLFSKTVAAAE